MIEDTDPEETPEDANYILWDELAEKYIGGKKEALTRVDTKEEALRWTYTEVLETEKPLTLSWIKTSSP